jgi:hypothetical protein
VDQNAITQYITDTIADLDTVVADDATFFFYDAGGSEPPDRRLPFATIVTSDAFDKFSNRNRPSVFRLNIGVSMQTFRALFGPSSAGATETVYDFTALDQIMPHPVYGQMFWVCVLNPSPETFEAIRPLLAEAFERAARRSLKSRPAVDS